MNIKLINKTKQNCGKILKSANSREQKLDKVRT